MHLASRTSTPDSPRMLTESTSKARFAHPSLMIFRRATNIVAPALNSTLDDAYLHVSSRKVGLQQEIKVVGAEQPLV